MNAVVDDEAGEIVYRDYCDIGLAVATPKGLMTPAIRNAQSLGFADVEKEIERFGALGAANAIAMEVRY